MIGGQATKGGERAREVTEGLDHVGPLRVLRSAMI